jgi:hypothetical protein
MTREELLTALKDISPPPEPGWWLPAPGFIGITLLLAAVIVTFWILLSRRRAWRLYLAASQELQRIKGSHQHTPDKQRLARELALWLKQVALLAFPERRLEGATGSGWLGFLDTSLGDTAFTQGVGHVFGDAVYQAQIELDAEHLVSLCERWLVAVKPRLLRRGRDRC